MGQPEAATDEAAVAEKPLELTWSGIGRDVEVLRGSSQEEVPDAAPDQVGDEPVVPEPVERAQGVRADLPSGDAVLLSGNDAWRHGRHHSTPRRKSNIQACGATAPSATVPPHPAFTTNRDFRVQFPGWQSLRELIGFAK